MSRSWNRVLESRRPGRGGSPPDRYVLYEAAVQDAASDLAFIARVYRRHRGRPLRLLREDFCGTAALACTWVTRGPTRRAWAVDRDAATLGWARAHRVPRLGAARERLTLLRGDARKVRTPRAEVVTALNCSYWVFQRRQELIEYFRAARNSLRPRGLLVLDLFGGEGATKLLAERRQVRGVRDYAGRKLAPFTYVWEQERFNPVDHRLLCHIHFEKLFGGRSIRRAFTYDWRLWTVPELRDALSDAGFRVSHLYVQGWDDDRNEALPLFRRRDRFENQEAWLAYLVAES